MMSTSKALAPHEIYIQRVKDREQRALRLRLGAILGTSVVVCLLIAFWPGRGAEANHVFHFATIDELSFDQVHDLLRAGDEQIIIQDAQGVIIDTIENVEEYLALKPKSPRRLPTRVAEVSRPDSFTGQVTFGDTQSLSEATPVVEVTPQKEPVPRFVLSIQGKAYVNETMNFVIPNYDPNWTYTLDFGNGEVKEVEANTRYAYTKEGWYTLGLSAQDKRQPHRKTKLTRTLAIRKQVDSKASDQSETVVAEITEVMDTENTNLPQESPIASAESSSSHASAQTELPIEGPRYPGGDAALLDFLARKLRYPKAALRKGVQGVVKVRFRVDQQGNLERPVVVQGLGFGCDREALRLVHIMPVWRPASQGLKRMAMNYTLDIPFKIPDKE